MAKRDNDRNRGKEAAAKRWGNVTREELVERRETLRKVLKELDNCITTCESFGFERDEAVRVDSATQWDRGIKLMENAVEQILIGIALHKRDKARGSRWKRA